METATKREGLDAEIQAAIDAQADRYAPAFPGVILLFRVGDAYYPSSLDRLIVETETDAPAIPYASAEARVRQIMEGGHRVAIVEQIAGDWHAIKSTARDYRELVEGNR